MNWLIIRSAYHKEQAVAVQIAKKGFEVWVPLQIVTARHPAARRHMDRSNVMLTKERPVCPSVLFAAVPADSVDRIRGIRHLERVEQTYDGCYALVPDCQVKAFREAIDAENIAARVLTETQRRKQKKRWKTLQEGLQELVSAIVNPVEQAA